MISDYFVEDVKIQNLGRIFFSVCLYIRFSVIDDRFLRDGSRDGSCVATIDVTMVKTMAKTLPILMMDNSRGGLPLWEAREGAGGPLGWFGIVVLPPKQR